jgi:2-polyprenyl-3-methyl-5-hydroxy-6-metoxy-1,4-benzoquinol methylase
MSAHTRTLAEHWDRIYQRRGKAAVSWYEPVPHLSLRLVTDAVISGHVVDVGAGASGLAANLVTRGYSVTLVDISHQALALDRTELGNGVAYIEADVLAWKPARQFDCWHDRAFFHFLVDPQDQGQYADAAAAAVAPGGALIMGVFAEDGPASCSGLPTVGRSPAELAAVFAGAFTLEHAEREEHRTPQGVVQPFTWVVLRRSAD